MKMDGLYPAVFSHPANLTSIALFKASVSTRPPLMPVVESKMIKGINHITLAVKNIEKSFKFYKDILGLKPVVKWKNGAYLTAGDTWIALNQDSKVSGAKRPDYSHIAFNCTSSDFQALKSQLLDFGCVEWSENESEGDSFYFLDPDGHKFEIHVGDLQSRLKEMQGNPWDTFEYY